MTDLVPARPRGGWLLTLTKPAKRFLTVFLMLAQHFTKPSRAALHQAEPGHQRRDAGQ